MPAPSTAKRRRSASLAALLATGLAVVAMTAAPIARAFSTANILRWPVTDRQNGSGGGGVGRRRARVAPLRMGSLPPFDSPYSQPEEEKNFWGNEYVPRLDHPGTMPPGTRLEDKPIEELSPVSNIPYPHFQEWPFHYRLPAYQPRRLDFIEWMTQRGLMVEDDGDMRGVRFLGRKRRFRAQKAQADKAAATGSDPMTPDERRQALEGIDGDYWRSEAAELVDPDMFIFEQAKTQRVRVPYIVKVREERAAKAAAEAAALGLQPGDEAAAAAAGIVGTVPPLMPDRGKPAAPKGRKKASAPAPPPPPTGEI